ncbi:hypothetical protein B0H19DRAFT_1208851 [Mycena capillaripes]|nr:hypothetical protein B0H19DRAFT_1208851 [Mycena capillaripes]
MSHYKPLALDESLYKAKEFTFIEEETGIREPDALKRHILGVQTKAYAQLHPFRCIYSLEFARTRISEFPAYQEVLKVGREREDAILLDLGWCCGTDIRKAVRDGFPIQTLIASDISQDFWQIGHELFRSTPETFPAVFVAGDALDPKFLEPFPPLTSPSEVTERAPKLSSLTCLTPLRGHVSVIHISFVFHLFLEEQQLQLARSLAGLLSPLRGSVILGCQVAQRWKGSGERISSFGHQMFCHSPESWQEMWEDVLPNGSVKIDAELSRRDHDGPDGGILTWSVTRI